MIKKQCLPASRIHFSMIHFSMRCDYDYDATIFPDAGSAGSHGERSLKGHGHRKPVEATPALASCSLRQRLFLAQPPVYVHVNFNCSQRKRHSEIYRSPPFWTFNCGGLQSTFKKGNICLNFALGDPWPTFGTTGRLDILPNDDALATLKRYVPNIYIIVPTIQIIPSIKNTSTPIYV